MRRLLTVELERFASRRLTLVASLGLLAVVVVALLSLWQTDGPASEEETAQARQFYEQQLADWEVNGDEQLAQCYEMEAEEQKTDPDVTLDCESWAPQEENYIFPDAVFSERAESVLLTIGYAVLFFAFFVGVSSVAAEFATGSMGSWLTFEPRRTRVYASKLLAVGIGLVLPSLVATALMVGGAWGLFASWGTLGDLDGELWGEIAVGALRLLLTAAGVGVLGAAIAMVLRSTAASIGVLFGYLIVVEGILGSALPALRPWLLGIKIEAVLGGGAEYFVQRCTTDAAGTMCESVARSVSLTNGAVSLVVLLAVVAAVGLVTFRRRDVG